MGGPSDDVCSKGSRMVLNATLRRHEESEKIVICYGSKGSAHKGTDLLKEFRIFNQSSWESSGNARFQIYMSKSEPTEI